MTGLASVAPELMAETGNRPLRLAYRIEESERLPDFRSIDIAFRRVERGVFEYLESFEQAHACLDRESEGTCRTAVDQNAGTQHVSAD